MWRCYTDGEYYLEWLGGLIGWFSFHHESIPNRFINIELIDYIEAAFLQLTSGKLLLGNVGKLLVDLLVNSYHLLMKSSSPNHSICASIVAWSERFPGELSEQIVESSRKRIRSKAVASLKNDFNELKDRILQWADEKQFSIDMLINWWIQYFNDEANVHLLIAGTFSNGKTSFIHTLLGEEILLATDLPTTSTLVHLHSGKGQEFARVTEQGIHPFSSLKELHSLTTIDHQVEKTIKGEFVDVAWPTTFFKITLLP